VPFLHVQYESAAIRFSLDPVSHFHGIRKNCFTLSVCLSVQKRSLCIKTAEEDFGSNVWLLQWLMLFSFGCLILLQTAKCAQLYSGIGSLLVEIIL